MKITYVILTCEKYLKERCHLIDNTWRNLIDKEDSFYFLSSIPNPEKKVLGYQDPDDYEGAPFKMMSFIKNADIDTDWIYLCDDDTFVFPNRLRKLLQDHDASKEVCVCRLEPPSCDGGKFKVNFCYVWPNGGAGIIMSKPFFLSLKKYMQRVKPGYMPYVKNGDISFGIWARLIKFRNWVNRSDVLLYEHPNHQRVIDAGLDKIVSTHQCRQEEFEMLYSLALKDIPNTNTVTTG
jgi:hypothetical protein